MIANNLKASDLTFYILNIHGFTMDKFSELLQSVFHVYDFVCLSETWMKTSERPNVEVKDYVCINNPRSQINKRAKRGSGGILLYFHNRVMENIEFLNDHESDDRLWIKCRSRTLTGGESDTFAFATCLQPTLQQHLMKALTS